MCLYNPGHKELTTLGKQNEGPQHCWQVRQNILGETEGRGLAAEQKKCNSD